jgi:hypothetical protein
VTLALAATAAVLLALGLVTLRVGERARLHSDLVAFRLTFPRGLEQEATASFLGGISGQLPPWWRRWYATPFILLEVESTAVGITHLVHVPRPWAPAIEHLLQATVPSVRYEALPDVPDVAWTTAAEYRIKTTARPLRVDAASLSTKLLTTQQPLERGEAIRVQWVLSPAGPVQPPRIAHGKQNPSILLPENVLKTSEEVAALKEKQRAPLLLGVARIATQAHVSRRAESLLRHVEVAWHETRAPGVFLRRRLLPRALVLQHVTERTIPLFSWPGTYNTEELSGLIGWPVGAVQIPGLVLRGYRQLPPSPLVPTTGTVLADSTFPGTAQPIAVDLEARLRHVHVLGPTGTGKSSLLLSMAIQDMAAGFGLVVLDPKGDLVRDLLARVPTSRRADVIVLDPADDERPVGLNPLHAADGARAEVVVENLVGLFKSLYKANWGPRTDDILRASLLALSRTGNATLCEVPALLTSRAYRTRVLATVDDPVGLGAFFSWYDRLSSAEQLNIIGPVLNKLRAFTMRPRVRGIIGQSTPRLQFPDVLANGKILLVSLASGLIGSEAAALLGALVVAELWHATTARAALPPNERRPVMAFLDEFQHFLHLPTDVPTVLAEARGLGLGVTLAHQFIGQLHNEARDAVLGTVRSRVVFQMPAADARPLARELGGILTADDLQGLGAFEVVVQAFAGGYTQPPATGVTRPAPPGDDAAEELLAASRADYGVDRQSVETALRTRQRTSSRGTQAPVGRRPRGTQRDRRQP